MAHQTFKVCILVDSNVENFYIKHYIDQINPVFNRFKNQVFTRNPLVNSPNLKIYWIDSENDQILVACEEDFRLFLEEGKGRKIFFSVNNSNQENDEDEDASIQMEAENIEQSPQGRKSRKNHKEDDKRCRRFEKLSKKLKHYEEACKGEEERSRCKHSEKREIKNNERLERAKRRVDQIRTIIGSIDPANLNSSSNNSNINNNNNNITLNENNNGEPLPSTSSSSNDSNPLLQSTISPELVRLISNAIEGCLQPCTLINKVLNEVFAVIPQVMEQSTGAAQNNVDQQQQTTEVKRNSTATNTSDANTPTPTIRQSNQEIEQLFKEAAKELEKMNEIVNINNNSNNAKMESSGTSVGTGSSSQLTQIERVFPNISDSAISDITIVENVKDSVSVIETDGSGVMLNFNEGFRISTPPKSMRSRESSIEIHDVSSVMSDDSRDWTMLSQDELSIEPVVRNVDPNTGAIPKSTSMNDATSQVDIEIQTNEAKPDSIKSSISIETQTPTSLLSGFPNQQQLQASVQKSIDIVQKSIETIQKSIDTPNVQKPESDNVAAAVVSNKIEDPKPPQPEAAPRTDIYPNLQQPTAPIMMPQQSKANANASRLSQIKPQQKFEPAVVVYDPNPKINSAVHTMMNMGFSNEDNWLTQLLINVEGDIPKALNFLTPQPKNRKP